MIVLRCTARLLRDVARHHPRASATHRPTSRLGEWYANRLNVGARRYIMATHATSLLSVVVPARDLRGLPERIATATDRLLLDLGVPAAVRAPEVDAMRDVRVTRTASGSVLASMRWITMYADTLLWDLPHRPGRTLADVNVALSDCPCGALGGGIPADAALLLLSADDRR